MPPARLLVLDLRQAVGRMLVHQLDGDASQGDLYRLHLIKDLRTFASLRVHRPETADLALDAGETTSDVSHYLTGYPSAPTSYPAPPRRGPQRWDRVRNSLQT